MIFFSWISTVENRGYSATAIAVLLTSVASIGCSARHSNVDVPYALAEMLSPPPPGLVMTASIDDEDANIDNAPVTLDLDIKNNSNTLARYSYANACGQLRLIVTADDGHLVRLTDYGFICGKSVYR